MGSAYPAGLLVVVSMVGAVLISAGAFAADPPGVTGRTDRTPKPGESFTLIFSLASNQDANYTITVSPRPEFAFTDLSNGSQTHPVPGGTTLDFQFKMQVSRSARETTYTFSYSVVRDGATVKMGTVDVKVGAGNPCSLSIFLLPVLGVSFGLALARRPGR